MFLDWYLSIPIDILSVIYNPKKGGILVSFL